MSAVVKMSVNLSAGVVDTLRALAAKRACSMTQVIVTAIADEKFLDDVVRDGGKVLVQDNVGAIQQVVFFR